MTDIDDDSASSVGGGLWSNQDTHATTMLGNVEHSDHNGRPQSLKCDLHEQVCHLSRPGSAIYSDRASPVNATLTVCSGSGPVRVVLNSPPLLSYWYTY